jgi:hypothetical protein
VGLHRPALPLRKPHPPARIGRDVATLDGELEHREGHRAVDVRDRLRRVVPPVPDPRLHHLGVDPVPASPTGPHAARPASAPRPDTRGCAGPAGTRTPSADARPPASPGTRAPPPRTYAPPSAAPPSPTGPPTPAPRTDPGTHRPPARPGTPPPRRADQTSATVSRRSSSHPHATGPDSQSSRPRGPGTPRPRAGACVTTSCAPPSPIRAGHGTSRYLRPPSGRTTRKPGAPTVPPRDPNRR